jgi:hypothetical protein
MYAEVRRVFVRRVWQATLRQGYVWQGWRHCWSPKWNVCEVATADSPTRAYGVERGKGCHPKTRHKKTLPNREAREGKMCCYKKLSHCVDALGQLALLVGGLLPMNHVLLRQLIDHAAHFFEKYSCFVFLGSSGQSLDFGARGLGLVAVSYTLGLICPDSFLC